jgi:hypothetical protein
MFTIANGNSALPPHNQETPDAMEPDRPEGFVEPHFF